MSRSFQANMRTEEEAVIYDLEGDLSHQSEDALYGLRDWERTPESGRRFVVFNLTRVSYINSIGIAVLIRIVRALRQGGCQVFAYGATPHYQKLFRIVGLSEHMPIYPSEASILQRLKLLDS
jgi:anti-anti-sigma factor